MSIWRKEARLMTRFILAGLAVAVTAMAADVSSVPSTVTFTKDVLPILQKKLSELSSARAGCPDVAADLSGGASLGQGDQGRRDGEEDAALVRGPELWAFR